MTGYPVGGPDLNGKEEQYVLHALGLGPGDEVIVPDLTFVARILQRLV